MTTKEQLLRQNIIQMCSVLVDGRYVHQQKDITLKWRGSRNQRLIDVQQSLKNKKVALLEEK